jgi:hypothetical protein
MTSQDMSGLRTNMSTAVVGIEHKVFSISLCCVFLFWLINSSIEMIVTSTLQDNYIASCPIVGINVIIYINMPLKWYPKLNTILSHDNGVKLVLSSYLQRLTGA